jgi:glucoamylase
MGIGRGWPLLTGERAHYELALGHNDSAKKLKEDMENFAGQGGLLPEQVWDKDQIPGHELYPGKPTGSAMPLAWAHGEYLKLIRSIKDKRVFDMPEQTVERYLKGNTLSNIKLWQFNHKIRTIPVNRMLRIETLAPATVHWTMDNWQTINDNVTTDTGLGVHYLDIKPSSDYGPIIFTFYWHHADTWEGTNFIINVLP